MRRILIVIMVVLLVAPSVAIIINDSVDVAHNEINTEDHSGKIKVKPIDKNGKELSEVDIKSLPQDTHTVANVELENTSEVKSEKMIVQIKSNSKMIISSDGKKLKQTKIVGKPLIELYYGYKKNVNTPWEQYARVDSCGGENCKVVYADFVMHKVWTELRSLSDVTGMVESDMIPVFDGVKV